ncbi:hypothetical protein BGZ94_009787 [Podila epigama]|nr:hypothetical protein BGZ94_009787 [Podila epigama]
MNPLHFAASRGHSEVVRVLIDNAGAGVDVQDREGETALLKASYAGSLATVCFLLKRGANVHQRDKDGWSALHNASSRGYIDIAQVLLEKGEADINARSKMGHTPLINAASKGDVAMVLYFLNHANANPLLKNIFSETAYDVAAAIGEAYLCDILQSSEKQWWKAEHSNDQPYDVQSTHNTVLLVVHENQRAIGSFPLSFMAPKFSAGALTQQDICGPWSLANGRPSTKDDVHLPLISGSSSGSLGTKASTQRGWFWLTEWTIDKTDPNIDSEGWQYGKSLTETNQVWSATAPTSGANWVRRRKWIRVMKKRVDMDKSNSSASTVGTSLLDDNNSASLEQVEDEQGDYIKRSNLALRVEEGFQDTKQELSRYQQAIQILLRGIKVDKNATSRAAAMSLVQDHLQHSEELSQTLQSQSAAYSSDFEAPTPQIASPLTQGNPGSPTELRRLTLLQSRPSDDDGVDEALHDQSVPGQGSLEGQSSVRDQSLDQEDQQHNRSEETDHQNDEQTEVQQDVQEQEDSRRSVEQELDELARLDMSTANEVEHAADDGARAGDAADTIPHEIPQENPQVADQAVAVASADPFPMARLTRSIRSSTPSSTVSSTHSNSNLPPLAPPPEHFEQHNAAIASANIVNIDSTSSLGLEQEYSSTADIRAGTSNVLPAIPTVSSSNTVPPQERTQVASSSSRGQTRQSPPQQYQTQQPPMGPLPGAKWESDSKAIECRECHRKFSMFLRRHHCRRCGHVVCDRCSSHRATLHPSMVVYDPSSSEAFIQHQTMSRRGTLQSYRVCDSCYRNLGSGRSPNMGSSAGSSSNTGPSQTSSSQYGSYANHHRSYQGQQAIRSRNNGHGHVNNGNHYNSTAVSSSYGDNGGVYLSSSMGHSGDMGVYSSSRSSSSSNIHQPTAMVRNASSSSLMSECPVCGAILAGLEGGKAAQEAHVQDCLEGKPGQGNGPINNVRYIGKMTPL